MLGLLLGAAILGVIISVMEDGEFPGWLPMIGCVLAAGIPSIVINALLPPELFIVGLAAGAACSAVAISALCSMTFKRALIASSIYLGIQVVISVGLYFALRS